MRNILFVVCVLLSSLSISQEYGRQIAKTLCSKEFLGRGYVKQGDSLAARFIESEFKKLKINPYPEKTYFQSFKNPVVAFPSAMTLMINQDTLIPGVDYMVDPNCGTVKGYWRYIKLSTAELFDDQLKYRFASSIEKEKQGIFSAVVDIRGLKGDSLRKATLDYIPMLAQAVDVMVLTDEKFTFSVGREPLGYGLIFIKGNKFKPAAEIYTDIKAKYLINHISSNVIGFIPSNLKKKKDREKAQTIVISAHYDHLGAMGEKTYFPGANDNASGVAMLLELAKYFKENPLEYNVMFIAFAGEEVGLLGSEYFVRYPWLDLKNIKFLVNLDIMGSGEEGITVVNGTKHIEEFNRLVKLNEEKKGLSLVKPRGEAANSDHYWFSQRGVPAFFIYTMGPNKNYHDVFDTYENLSFAKFNDIKELMINFIRTF
jgi:aminopeptidase YwaD